MIQIAQPMIGKDEIAAVERVLRSRNIADGRETALFEGDFSSLFEGRICVAVNSGTSALQLALIAAGIGPGDEVILPSFTFAATANAVCMTGAKPVFADIEPKFYGLSASSASAAITSRTAAILPVHLYGHLAPMEEIASLAENRGLFLIEDAAQALGASLSGKPAGTWGHAAAFSFHATKNITTGEGGMVVTADPQIARIARLLRSQGMDKPYHNEIIGFNMRMTDISAAIGRVQLKRLGAFNCRRRANAQILNRFLGARISTPAVAPDAVHVYSSYTIRSMCRDAACSYLRSEGIDSRPYYSTPVHKLAPYSANVDLPETDRAARQVMSLPVGPHLKGADMERIAATLTNYWTDLDS